MKQLQELVSHSPGQYFCVKVEKGEVNPLETKLALPASQNRIDHFYIGKLDEKNVDHLIYPGQALLDLRIHSSLMLNYIHADTREDKYIQTCRFNEKLILPFSETDLNEWGRKLSHDGGTETLVKYVIGSNDVLEALRNFGVYRKMQEPETIKGLFHEIILCGVQDRRNYLKSRWQRFMFRRSSSLNMDTMFLEENARDEYPD